MKSILVLMLACAAVCAEDLNVDEVLARVEAAEGRVSDMSAKFRQETRLAGTGERQVITGEFEVIREPARFRIRYTSPVEQVVVFDGKELIMYFPETGQAFRQKTTLADISRLIGIDPAAPTKAMRDRYEAKLGECGDKSCKIVFSVAPEARRQGAADLTWRVKLSRDTWMVEEAEMDTGEIEMKIRVFQYRPNQGLEPGSLGPDLPPGTDVFDGIPQLFGPGPRGKPGK